MSNPSPLEKQLFHLDLSKGLNEQDRPETAAPATTITRLENLIQDQTGAWVKRPGTYYMGLAHATSIGNKCLKLREGLAVVASGGEFCQWGETSGVFRQRGGVSPYVVSSEMVVAAGPTLAAECTSSATGSQFHITVTDSGKGTANAGEASAWVVTVYDRNTGCSVARYDVARLFGAAFVIEAVATLVDDRYIHIWAYDGGTAITGVGGIAIDTTALPASDTIGLTFQNTTAPTSGDILDLTHGSGRSFLLTAPGPTVSYVLAMDNLGNVAQRLATITAVKSLSYSSYGTPSVWAMSSTSFESFVASSLAASGGALHGSAFVGPTVVTMDSTGVMWVADQYNVTLTGATAVTSTRFYKSSVVGTPTFAGRYGEVQGWTPCSQPMEVLFPSGTTEMHIHMRKQMAATGVEGPAQSPHVVVNMTPVDISIVSVGYSPYTGVRFYYSARVVAVLEPSFGADVTKSIRRTESVSYSRTEYGCLVPIIVAARSVGFAISTIKTGKVYRGCMTEVLGLTNYISGGAHAQYVGGAEPGEVGFVDIPRIGVLANATAGLPNGAVKYVAAYRYVDDSGAVTWSRVSSVASASPVLKQVTVEVMAPAVTNRDIRTLSANYSPSVNSVELYRTVAGGTTYYLCAGTQPGSTQTLVLQAVSNNYALSDNMSDLTLVTKAQLFRQPGTPNSAVDRYPPPAGNILCQHKDRLFTVDTLGSRVCYSSFFVDGETAWYNPQFSFFVHGGSGPITGLASMDGRLLVFKRDAIFVIDGDGPGEAGVTGNEYSPPQRLATQHGCADHRTILVCTDGIMYRSPRGFELLNRGLQVKFIGARVQTTTDENQFNMGCAADATGKLRWLLSNTDTAGSTELVYDDTSEAWSKNTYAGFGQYDVCVPDLLNYGRVPIYCQASGYVLRQTAPLDGIVFDFPYSSYTPFVLETGWIRTGQQARARFTKVLALLKKNTGSNHKLTMSVSVQFASAVVQTFTWEPDTINALEIEALELQLARQEVMAIKLLITDAAPTDTATYPTGDARGPDILGISFEIASKTGAPKGPSGHQA